MKFIDYHFSPEITQGINQLGWTRPTDIQYKSIPPILRGEDVLAVAQTGTGKTASFAIPIIHSIQKYKNAATRKDGIKCIVLVPTHELAIQIAEVFESIARHTSVKVKPIIGGVDQAPQIKALEKRVDIIIATPGRMFDLISQEHLKIHRVNTVVFDEADHMLDLGFIKDIRDLSRKLPYQRQTLFFSATINEKIKKLAYSLIRKSAIRIHVSPRDPVAKNIEHAVTFVEMDDKRFILEHFIKNHLDEKILVFVRTIVRAERLAKAMDRVGLKVHTIHREKTQHERDEVLDAFRDGRITLLIATDISSRGIDISNVYAVINYDLPEKAENYVHRVGRTGRGKKKGKAISFCSTGEMDLLNDIEAYTNSTIERIRINPDDISYARLMSDNKGNDYMKLIKEAEEMESKKKRKKNN